MNTARGFSGWKGFIFELRCPENTLAYHVKAKTKAVQSFAVSARHVNRYLRQDRTLLVIAEAEI